MRIKEISSRISHSYLALVAWRILILYVTLTLLRCVFCIYNSDLIAETTLREGLYLFGGSLRFDTASLIYVNALWLVLSLIPLRFRTNVIYQKVLCWIYMVSNTLFIVALNLCDTVYFHYTQKRFTSDEFIFMGNDNNSNLLFTFFIENLHLVLLLIAMVYLIRKAYMCGRECEDQPKDSRIYYPLHTSILVIMMWLAVCGLRGGFTRIIRPQTLSNATLYTPDSEKAFMILSNPFCIIRTMGKSLKVTKYFDKERLEAMFTPYHYPPPPPSAVMSKYRGYNVVIFIIESFSAENSAYLCPDLYEEGDVGYMPFLDSLMSESVVMRKMYANGKQSIYATPAVIGSLPSLEVPFVLLPQSMGKSYQLPAILKDEGYNTHFFCGSSNASMGFSAYARTAGFDNYYALEDYQKRHGNYGNDGIWGITDIPFTEYAGEVMCELEEPFFTAQFTISSHHPFNVPKEFDGELPEGRTQIQPVTTYTDLAFRNFFDKYQDEEWFNRTIFVFVSDHVSSEKMADRTRKYPGNHHIIGLIYTKDGSLKGEVNDVTQQVDIMPTTLGLLGYDKPYFAFGRDIFNEEDRPKWSVVYDGRLVAYDNDGVVQDLKSSEMLRAYEQQYIEHVTNVSFIAPERN